MNRGTALTLAMIVVVAAATPSRAATWTVSQDGTGDFLEIQDAVDAAVAGDSVLIGPGRYETFRHAASTVDGFLLSAIVWVTTPDLTIIGSGPDETVVGPAVYTQEALGRPAGGMYLDGGCAGLILKDLAVENMSGNVTIRDDVTLVEGCRLTSPDPIAATSMSIIEAFDTVVRNCEFVGEDGLLTGSGSGRIVIEGCTYNGAVGSGTGFSIGNGAPDCIVRDCRTNGGSVGISVYLGASATIERLVVNSPANFGVDVSQGTAVLRNSHIGVTRLGLRVGGPLEVYDTIIEGSTEYTIITTSDLVVRGSHILNGGGLSVFGRTSVPGLQVDLRHNWWGTDDESQIAAWIDDFYGTVIWQPIADTPIPTGSSSVGGLKGRFHRDGAPR